MSKMPFSVSFLIKRKAIMQAQIKMLMNEDVESFKELIALFAEVFETENFSMANDAHLLSLLQNPNFTVLTANMKRTIVGGLTAYTLQQYYSEKPLAYIYDLAVKQQYQRQGIGKQLVNELLRFYKEKGFEEVFVQAEMEDEHAVNFYRASGALEKQVGYFYYPLT
jgi:aminoglycoside 3-N-acetyltransferase I